jgi:hypothetical protein
MSGANNPMYGRTGELNPMYGRTGELNPMYGKVPANAFESGNVPANAMTINIYDIDNVLVHSFPSQVAAAKWLNIPRTTFREYISTGKVWNNQYIFRKSK